MEKIGKYQLLETVGKGAMGEIYKAHDEIIDRTVAIKVIHAHFVEDELWESLKERFQQEARAAARCFHPNIITIFDFGIENDTPYLVMEFVQGQDLKEQLKSSGKFSIDEAINIMALVLDGLHCAHESGVIHRDIKPANIIQLNNKQIKLTDFGIARVEASDLTAVGDMVGTPVYMSPESMRGDQVDARADIYSVALVFIELVTGEKPITGFIDNQSLREAFKKHQICTQKNAHLIDVLTHALHRQPDYRFQTAKEFSDKLTSLLKRSDPTLESSQLTSAKLSASSSSSHNSKVLAKETMAFNHIEKAGNNHVLAQIENALASYIGPLSSVLVKRKSSTCSTQEQLISELASHINKKNDREAFINDAHKRLSSSSLSFVKQTSDEKVMKDNEEETAISDERIQEIKAVFSVYLGPMASILIKKALNKSDGEQSLIQLLANKIPSAQERAEFLAAIK